MQAKLDELKARLALVDDLEQAAALLEWDQQTQMPPAGAPARAEHLATLHRLAHEKFTADEVGRLLDDLGRHYAGAPAEDDAAALVRAAARRYRRKQQIPAVLVEEQAKVTSLAQQAWARARAENDFGQFVPHLERVYALKRREAACFPEVAEPYDALLDDYEPGMRTAQVRAMFAELREAVVPLLAAIAARPPVDDSVLRRDYDEAGQWDLSVQAIRAFGFDMQAGRQDKSVHPFCTSFSPGDVRITTRVDRNWLPTCLMGSLHECGHALYEQGLPMQHRRTPLGRYASLGIHESQSRMWENLVGRSRGYWEWFYPRLQAAFPTQLGDVPLETFYRAINKVQPTFIRVEADEVTYNLHTMLRFELEVDLLEGTLAAQDAPAAWNAKFKEYFGVDVTSNRVGILQDIHWSAGLIGYFPTYTIGNLASVQFFEKAKADLPDLQASLDRGEFAPLLGWLRENIHCQGARYLPAELVEKVTGKPLTAEAYLRYVQEKYEGVYGI
jgi:carboxypeptidase Taq